MSVNEGLRAMAGFFVLLSLALGTWLHPGWYLFYGFCGYQSAAVSLYSMVSSDGGATPPWLA